VSIQQQQLSQARYIDSVQPAEIFADSLHTMVWDGNTLRIEFCVTRFPDAALKGEKQPEQHPACRLILTAPLATALFNRLQETMNALAKTGIVSAQKPEEAAAR
jgi:hypothetical protein